MTKRKLHININLDKDFVTTLKHLNKKYGDQMCYLNGLADKQINYTEFIDQFVKSTSVADASIDSNANIDHKDITTLENEMSKPHSKLLAFHKIFYEMKKKYGLKEAKKWAEEEWNGGFYLHDFCSATFRSYCFSGDTRIMTKQGLRRLDELNGSTVSVLNKNHGWEEATVKWFGKQELRKLTLTRYDTEQVFYVTGNHKWFTINKRHMTTEVETDQLTPGMKIPFNTTKTWADVEPSPFGVAHGFFIGDGDKGSHRRVNFCGDKIALLPYFTPAKVSGPEYERTTRGVPNAFTKLPDLSEPVGYLYGWLAGYFAADGCVDTKGRCTLSSTNKEYLECAQNILCVLGMPVNNIRYQDRVSNLTHEMGRVYVLTISSEYLRENFFIRPTHRERWLATVNKGRHHRAWIVKSVEDTGIIDDVYCAVAKKTHSFTLEGNVLTHNCFAYDLTPLVNKGLFFVNNFNAQPPQHLTTYTDFVGEMVSWCANRTSGAVGLPNFLIYSFYFWKKDCENKYYLNSPEYYRDQEFQRIIYKLNQPYLRVTQSAFTNFSIFDREYLMALFGGVEYPDGTCVIDYIDELIEYQKAFMEKVSEIRSINMMTFPVLTYALLRIDGKFVDEDFAKWCCKHNMKWADSNFFISKDVTSLSNCCRLVSDVKNLG